MADQPLHPNDELLIRQLCADASKRHRAIPIDGHNAVIHRTNMLMIVAFISEVLARRQHALDTRNLVQQPQEDQR